MSLDNKKPFHNKVALVTGSGRGIGRAIALHMADLGAHVVVNFFRNRAPAEETVAEVRSKGGEAIVVKANIGDIDQINVLFDSIEKEFDGLDFFISNAASGYNRPVMEQKPKGWDWTMNINARALLFAAKRAVPLMEKRGKGAIVSISSPGSTRVMPDYVVVGASKAAQEALIRYLAVELAPKNIIANAVSPGMVNTDALQHFDVIRSDKKIIERVTKQTPAGRIATPQDIAKVVAFLCSPDARMICGQTIVVDGGFTLPLHWPE